VPAINDLILLRHGEVASHRGDVPLTRVGHGQAEQAGRQLADVGAERAEILVGPTLRAQQTGLILLHGWTRHDASCDVKGPGVTAALRNPDLYLAGHRVDMVSTAAAFAEQVPGATEAQVTAIGFYAGFLTSADRIGFWLNHADPPGEDADAVAARITQFATSLGPADGVDLVVGITHSPVLRAVMRDFAGTDPGEPDYLSGCRLRIEGDGSLVLSSVDWKQADLSVTGQVGGRQWSR
jgi:broad specificity phosphatase PhoE